MKRQFLIVIVVSIFIAPLFSSAQEEKTQFTNVTNILGIGEYGGSGVSWGDYDGDGQEDLLLCGGGTKLLKNDKGKFRDVTKDVKLDTAGGEVGYWGDYDNDGDLDIFFTPDKLLRNDNSIFVDVSKEAGFPALGGKYAIESAAWGDYDGDGYIDIVIPCIYPSDKPWTPAPLFLIKNNGNGTFTDVTKKVGFSDAEKSTREPRGVAWCDYDNDGDLDLYVSCYRLYADYLFRNNGDGTFTNVAKASGIPQEKGQTEVNGHELGVAWADFDRDGYFDIYTTPQHDGNRLYKNQGPPKWNFENIAAKVGALAGTDKFRGPNNEHLSCALGDYDNDGWMDIYATMETEGGYPNQLLHNKNDGTFENVTKKAGFDKKAFGHSAAWCDYDHDGDLDLVVSGGGTGVSKTPNFVKLYRNDSKNSNHWLHIKLVGKKINRSAIGARVMVVAEKLTQILEVDGGSGSMSQNSLILEFGLGKAKKVDKVTIRWTNGKLQDVAVDSVDKAITVEETSGEEGKTYKLY